jgi:hypothetical protein
MAGEKLATTRGRLKRVAFRESKIDDANVLFRIVDIWSRGSADRTAFAALLKLTFAASIVAVMGAVAAAQSYPRSEVEVRLGRP